MSMKETKQHRTVIGLSWNEKNQLASDIFDYTGSPVHLHKPNKVYVTQEIGIIRSQQTAVKQNPFYTSIPGVLRDPQCEVRHHISLSVTSNNKVLTAKKSSQMAGLPFFLLFLSFHYEKKCISMHLRQVVYLYCYCTHTIYKCTERVGKIVD